MYTIDKIVSTKTKICKLVYRTMQQQKVEQPLNVFNKWRTYFNNELSMEDWLNSFEIIFSCTKFLDLYYFHFKMLHQILANNEALHKWGVIQSDLCNFCNEEIETIYHTYLECEVSKHFWQDLNIYI